MYRLFFSNIEIFLVEYYVFCCFLLLLKYNKSKEAPMKHNKLQDMKKNHLYIILNELYLNKDATINELIEKTNLSQPSIRNMLRTLQTQNIIIETGNDFSTGGRCPTRFALNQEQFRLLCILIQNNIAQFYIVYEDLHLQISYQNEEELISKIKQMITQYSIHCCILSVEGIVQGYTYITDHFDSLEKHTWIDSLKQSVDIPICLENDVKAMHYGQFLHNSKSSSFYLHINQLGIGSSYINHEQLLHGQNGIAGEIGLIPYHGIPLNLAMRKCQNQQQFNELLIFLFTIIVSTFDPPYIYVSIDNKWKPNILNEPQYLQHLLPLKIENQIEYHQDFIGLMFEGLQYIGIQYLLNKIIQGE